jgi:hypothetical protein
VGVEGGAGVGLTDDTVGERGGWRCVGSYFDGVCVEIEVFVDFEPQFCREGEEGRRGGAGVIVFSMLLTLGHGVFVESGDDRNDIFRFRTYACFAISSLL